MERVRRALELARAERVRVAHAGTAGTTTTRSPPRDARSVAVNPDALRAWHVLPPGMGDPLAPAFAALRTRLLPRLEQHGWRTLAVVSPAADEGKTFTAINLAIAVAAATPGDVLLVDLDLRRPRLNQRFGFLPQAGVEECLRGAATLADAAVTPDGYPGLLLLPARATVANPCELLASEPACTLLAELRRSDAHRYVIYDLPPVLGSDEVPALAAHLDAALMVIADGRTRRDDVRRCCAALPGLPIVGTVLNGTRGRAAADAAG